MPTTESIIQDSVERDFMIILDFGSGNSCLNRWNIAKRMIDSLAEVDEFFQTTIKWQLFEDCHPNIPLDRSIFYDAFYYANDQGFKTTASVFDLDSLNFLLTFNIPFVKIANRRDLDWLIGEVPRKIPIIRSVALKDNNWNLYFGNVRNLCCVSEYPAFIDSYVPFGAANLTNGISDHTTDWTLYRKYQPEIYEVHFRLEDTTGPDSGPFARVPEQVREIL